MKQNCELCGGPARLHCESDQASLCWGCDRKVHGANFLVAKHKRCLLCQTCQRPTAWVASGHIISSAVSVCDTCVREDPESACESEAEVGQEDDESEDEGFDDYDDDEDHTMDCDDEEEEGDNQVVPWSVDPLPASPPL